MNLHRALAVAIMPSMSTATLDQFEHAFAVWLAAAKAQRSMGEWLAAQDQRMGRAFGGRMVADSAAVLDDLRSEH